MALGINWAQQWQSQLDDALTRAGITRGSGLNISTANLKPTDINAGTKKNLEIKSNVSQTTPTAKTATPTYDELVGQKGEYGRSDIGSDIQAQIAKIKSQNEEFGNSRYGYGGLMFQQQAEDTIKALQNKYDAQQKEFQEQVAKGNEHISPGSGQDLYSEAYTAAQNGTGLNDTATSVTGSSASETGNNVGSFMDNVGNAIGTTAKVPGYSLL